MRGENTESFTSSISRTRGAERLAVADARRREELDRLIAQTETGSNLTRSAQIKLQAERRARERKRRGRNAPETARPATIAPRVGWDKGGGI